MLSWFSPSQLDSKLCAATAHMLLALSDLVLSSTLLVNACAPPCNTQPAEPSCMHMSLTLGATHTQWCHPELQTAQGLA